MKYSHVLLVYVIVSQFITGQSFILESTLNSTIEETSGLLFTNNTLITHNDSGNSNDLFDIDPSTGSILRDVTISNTSNIDWEDIAEDNDYIYIGDFGNFDATRTDLKVLRILKSDYFNSNTVTADIINFSYDEQTDFSSQPFSTNFDAEALIHFNGSLYIFTKNWADGNSNVYLLPKTPGTYSLSKLDTIASQGLVTGGTPSIDGSSIVLCGYDINGPFIFELNGFSAGLFSNGTTTKTTINPPLGYSFQTEGIAPINSNEYYVSAEAANGDLQGLYRFNISTLSTSFEEPKSYTIYPNPTQDILKVSCSTCLSSIYSVSGQLLLKSKNSQIDISDLTNGFYIIQLEDQRYLQVRSNLKFLIRR